MNENDENRPSTRLTRAKAAALSAGDAPTAAAKKPLETKKAATSTTTTGTTRRRAALGDVSNVTKGENGAAKEGKKPAGAKVGLTSKATMQAGGVAKLTRTNSSRTTALTNKTTNTKKPTEDKEKRSGPGSIKDSAQKRQKTTQDNVLIEEPPRKKVEVEKKLTEKKLVTEKAPAKEIVEAAVEPTTLQKPAQDLVEDLDTEDLDDPLMVAEYVVEIFEYMKDLELETLPNPHYIDHQPDLEWKMRGILVDWLIEVHTRFRLLPETLFLAVNIIDRFLSAEVVALDRLQLVGVAAMFIASKYEEVLSPHVANFSHVADETFTDKEILDAERHILATLEYNMSYPNPMNFLRRISKADNYDIQTRTLGKYLMEISLLDHRFMAYRQSHVSAAAMYLARLILERGPWVCCYYSAEGTLGIANGM